MKGSGEEKRERRGGIRETGEGKKKADGEDGGETVGVSG